jgi:hypothetical protein
MPTKMNKVCHFHAGVHDKVYILSLKYTERHMGGGFWSVNASWGRRGGVLQSAVKSTSHTYEHAWHDLFEIFKQKLEKGYLDIESVDYHGPLSIDKLKAHLSSEDFELEDLESASSHIGLPDDYEPMDYEEPEKPAIGVRKVVCINNLGLEDKFDEGVEYEFLVILKEADMLLVTGKDGKATECFKERFKGY